MIMRSLLLTALTCFVACSSEQPPLIADQVNITKPVPGVSMGAGYLTLRNTSDQIIAITQVSSPDLESVEMHESVLEDGVSRMYKLQEVAILPGGSTTFEPGAKHLMLRYPDELTDSVTLQFYAGETLLLSVDATLGDQK